MLAVDGAPRAQNGRGLARARVFAFTRRGARGEVPHRARGAGERLAGVLPERRRPLVRVRGRCVGRRVGLRSAPAPLFLAFFIGIADSREWLLPKMRPAAHRIDRVGVFTGSERPNASVGACQFGAAHEIIGVGGESCAAPPRDRGA